MNLSFGVKALIVIICALVSVITGMVAGLLNHDPGTPKRKSVIFGGGVFGGCMILCVTVLTSLGVF